MCYVGHLSRDKELIMEHGIRSKFEEQFNIYRCFRFNSAGDKSYPKMTSFRICQND